MMKKIFRYAVFALMLAACLICAAACGEDDSGDVTTTLAVTTGEGEKKPENTALFTEKSRSVKLRGDYTLTDADCTIYAVSLDVDLGGYTLDLAGKTLSVSGKAGDGNLAIHNGSVKNGKLALTMVSGSVVLDRVTLDGSVTADFCGNVVAASLIADEITHSGGAMTLNAGTSVGKTVKKDGSVTVAPGAGISLLTLDGKCDVKVDGAVLFLDVTENAGGSAVTVGDYAAVAGIGARAPIGVTVSEHAYTVTAEKLSGVTVTSEKVKATDATAEAMKKAAADALLYRFASSSLPDCHAEGSIRFAPTDPDEKRGVREFTFDVLQHQYVKVSETAAGRFLDGVTRYECSGCGDRYFEIDPAEGKVADCETLSELLFLYAADCNFHFNIDEDVTFSLPEEETFTLHSLDCHIILKEQKPSGAVSFTATSGETDLDFRAYLKDGNLTVYSAEGETVKKQQTTLEAFLSDFVSDLFDGETDGAQLLASVKKAVADAGKLRLGTYLTDREIAFLGGLLSAASSIGTGGESTAALPVISSVPDYFDRAEHPLTGQTDYVLSLERFRAAAVTGVSDRTVSEYIAQLTGVDLSPVTLLLGSFRSLPSMTLGTFIQTLVATSDAVGVSAEEMLASANELLSAATGNEVDLAVMLIAHGNETVGSLIGLDAGTWKGMLSALPRVLELKVNEAWDLFAYTAIGNRELGNLLSYESLFGEGMSVDDIKSLRFSVKNGEIVSAYAEIGDIVVLYSGTTGITEITVTSGDDVYLCKIDPANASVAVSREVPDSSPKQYKDIFTGKIVTDNGDVYYELTSGDFRLAWNTAETESGTDITLKYGIPVKVLGKTKVIEGKQVIRATVDADGTTVATAFAGYRVYLKASEPDGAAQYAFGIETVPLPGKDSETLVDIRFAVLPDGTVAVNIVKPETGSGSGSASETLPEFDEFFKDIEF